MVKPPCRRTSELSSGDDEESVLGRLGRSKGGALLAESTESEAGTAAYSWGRSGKVAKGGPAHAGFLDHGEEL